MEKMATSSTGQQEKLSEKYTKGGGHISFWVTATALVSFATSIINFSYTILKTHTQDEKISRLGGDCNVSLEIDKSLNSKSTISDFMVNGTSTIHSTCKNVFIVIRNVNDGVWQIANITQLKANGKWDAPVNLDKISRLGEKVEITARVTSQTSEYSIGQFLSAPPIIGTTSNNTVYVNRTK